MKSWIRVIAFMLAVGGTMVRGADDCCCQSPRPVCPPLNAGCQQIYYAIGSVVFPGWIKGAGLDAPANASQCGAEELYSCAHAEVHNCYVVTAVFDNQADCQANTNQIDLSGGALIYKIPKCATQNCPN